MSKMGEFALELDEFVTEHVYNGLCNEDIHNEWKRQYKNTDYYHMGLMYLNGKIMNVERKMFGLHYVDLDEAYNKVF